MTKAKTVYVVQVKINGTVEEFDSRDTIEEARDVVHTCKHLNSKVKCKIIERTDKEVS